MLATTSLDDLLALGEGVDVEFKRAAGRCGKGAVPGSVWESIAAMANTRGGRVVPGVSERDGQFSVTGLGEPQRVRGELWAALNNPSKMRVRSNSDGSRGNFDSSSGNFDRCSGNFDLSSSSTPTAGSEGGSGKSSGSNSYPSSGNSYPSSGNSYPSSDNPHLRPGPEAIQASAKHNWQTHEQQQAAVLWLCRSDWKTLDELAEALGRKKRTIQRHYVRPLLKSGRLETRHARNHPKQAYRATPGEHDDDAE